MNDVIEITFKMDRKLYASVIRKRLSRSKRVIIAYILACLSGLLFYFSRDFLFVFSIAIAVYVAMVIRFWTAPSRWLSTAPYLTNEKTLRFTQDRIALETSEVKSEFPWDHYIAWHESPLYFMLDLTPEGFCSVIPKESMTSEQQEQFRNWASAKLPKYPKRLKRK